MLEIGLHGLSLLLTVVVIAAAKKGGNTIGGPGGYAAGMVLGYAYARSGTPWSILSDKFGQVTGTAGGEFGVSAAAIALTLFGLWWYLRPKLVISIVLGLLTMTAAEAASGTWKQVASILGSFINILAG